MRITIIETIWRKLAEHRIHRRRIQAAQNADYLLRRAVEYRLDADQAIEDSKWWRIVAATGQYPKAWRQ